MSEYPDGSVAADNSVAADHEAVARSPIAPAPPVRVEAGWEVSGRRSDASLSIADHTPLAKVHLRAPWNGAMAKALGVPFGRAGRESPGPDGRESPGPDGREGAWLVVGSGPGEWYVLAPPGAAAAAAGWLGQMAAEEAGEEFVSVVDLTHGRALMRVTGRDAAELLARLCGADLHDDMAPDGAALRSAVAGVATDIIRDDRAGVASYLLHCERSSGQYLFDALVSAGESLGIGVDGFRLPGI
ncbi:MAG TPA: sarcosine oxidase subunit gamma family protein [Streptosporangiaceae bacterium]